MARAGRGCLMSLSWDEGRARVAAFARKCRDAAYEKGETQSFYNDFFEASAGVPSRATRGTWRSSTTARA